MNHLFNSQGFSGRADRLVRKTKTLPGHLENCARFVSGGSSFGYM